MKKPFVTAEQLEDIAARYPTPFHLYDAQGIRENARRLKAAFSWNPGYREYFAVKATPTPAILKILQEEGCGCDCSSLTELMMAERIGCTGENIMFSSNETPAEDYRLAAMLMYGKEASNQKQEIDRQHHTIPNQRANDKHHGNVYNLLFRYGKVRSQNMEKLKSSFPTFCKRTFPQLHKIASYTHYAQCRLLRKPSHFIIYSRK